VPAADAPQRAEPVPVSPAAAQRLADKVASALEQSGPVRLLVTEEELTSYLALSLSGSPFSDLQVRLVPGALVVSAQLQVPQLGALGHHHLQGTLTTAHRGEVLRINLQQGLLDGRPLPRFLLASLEEAVNDLWAEAGLSLHLQQITLGEGWLLCSATTEPAAAP
jgi:hypothetical protein